MVAARLGVVESQRLDELGVEARTIGGGIAQKASVA